MNKIFFSTAIKFSLQILLGIIFIFSGIIKLYPIEPFEYTLVEQGFTGWNLAPFISRGIISAELFFGLLLLLNMNRESVLKGVLILLILFTGYLAWDIVKSGNDWNCGCFGTFLEMTPAESIIKNMVMIIIILYLLKFPLFSKWGFHISPKWKVVLLLVSGGCSLSLPLILNPVGFAAPGDQSVALNEKIDLGLLPVITENDTAVNYEKGEKILAFFSVRCQHCKETAYKLSILKRQYNIPPVYIFFIGSKDKVVDFFKASRSHFPFAILSTTDFFRYSQYKVPAVLFVRNSILLKRWDPQTLNYRQFEIFGRKY